MKILIIFSIILCSCSGTRPINIGIINGKLAELADKPNNVSTMTNVHKKKMNPISFLSDLKSAKKAILNAIKDYGSTEIVVDNENYLHVEFSTFVGWVDDVEFYLDDKNKLIHFRSASRIGTSDFGTNRERMEELTRMIQVNLRNIK